MNAIEHGNGNRPEIPVEVEVTQNGDEIIVAISDQGGEAHPARRWRATRNPTWSRSSTAARARAAGACSSSATWSTRWT